MKKVARESMLLCATCGAESEILDPKWDHRRFDEKGEPIIWVYLEDDETDAEKWARCPDCVSLDKRMPLGEMPDWVETLIVEYQERNPENGKKVSREKAFSKIWEIVRNV